MRRIDLRYGSGTIPFEYDVDRFEVLIPDGKSKPMSDIAIGQAFEDPIGTSRLEDIAGPGETVLFVVSDATRKTAAGQMMNLLVRRLIASSTDPSNIAAIFATGIHRPVTEAEKARILTPFIAQRVKSLNHYPRDLMQLVRVGETSGGITVELNRALTEFDNIVTLGSINFHYFAGFTGGRKLICPGLASAATVTATHKLAFDCDIRGRRDGVGSGRLAGNPVHEAFVDAASFARVKFAVNTIVDDEGLAVEVFCGDPVLSHEAACASFGESNTVKIREKRECVVVSCGGAPHDINLIQAHKSLEAASKACIDGGKIILVAECTEGTGQKDLVNWFKSANSEDLAARLCEKYQVNGQTAWNLMRLTERFDVVFCSAMNEDMAASFRMRPLSPMDVEKAGTNKCTGYIIPEGNRLNIVEVRSS